MKLYIIQYKEVERCIILKAPTIHFEDMKKYISRDFQSSLLPFLMSDKIHGNRMYLNKYVFHIYFVLFFHSYCSRCNLSLVTQQTNKALLNMLSTERPHVVFIK